MDEFSTDEFESHFSAFVNEDENYEHEDYCCYDKDIDQDIEAELYQQIYFESNENTSNKCNSVVVGNFVNDDSNPSLEMRRHDESTTKKKRKQKDNNESLTKKFKKDCADSSIKKTRKTCINQIEDTSDDDNTTTSSLMQNSLINNEKSQSKSSIRAAIEAAGITVADLKKIVNKDLVYKDISFGYSSDSGASKDGEISRIEDDGNKNDIISSSEYDSDGSYYGNDDNDGDEDINLNIIKKTSCKSKSMSDSILDAILKKMPDGSSWNISESDTMARPRVSLLRFYNSSMRARCHNCNDRGHLRDDCPEPKKVPKCILCGKAGHVLRNCADQICFRCGQPGHTARECEEKVAGRADRCRRCFTRGHFEERCPDNWRQYHLTIEPGEIIRRKDVIGGSSKDEMVRTCYNCGKNGHLGHVCTDSRLDKYQTAFSPFVFKYDRKPSNSVSERKVSRTKSSKKDESTSSSSKRLPLRSSGGRHHGKSNKYGDDDRHGSELEITFDVISKSKVSKSSSKRDQSRIDDSHAKEKAHKDEKPQLATHIKSSKPRCDKIDKDYVSGLSISIEKPNKSYKKTSSSNEQTSKKLTENGSGTVSKTIEHKSTSNSSNRKISNSINTRTKLMLSNDFPRNPVRNATKNDDNFLPKEKNGGRGTSMHTSYSDDDDNDLPVILKVENVSKSARRKKLRKEKRNKASIEDRNAETSRTPKFKEWWRPNDSSARPMSSTPISSTVTNGKFCKESKTAQTKTPAKKTDFNDQQKIDTKHCVSNNGNSVTKNVIVTPKGFRLTLI